MVPGLTIPPLVLLPVLLVNWLYKWWILTIIVDTNKTELWNYAAPSIALLFFWAFDGWIWTEDPLGCCFDGKGLVFHGLRLRVYFLIWLGAHLFAARSAVHGMAFGGSSIDPMVARRRRMGTFSMHNRLLHGVCIVNTDHDHVHSCSLPPL